MSILSDAVEEARRLVAAGAEQGLTLRLLGGMAVKLHSPSASHRSLARAYPDLDFALAERQGYKLEALMPGLGYEPNKQFNLLNGAQRLLFFDEANKRQVDVFVAAFHMCHTIPITERIALEPLTLPLAELLLTKLQIVELNEKDARDICALLLDHPCGEGDAETLNVAHLARLCADDWGLWKTIHVSLDKVSAYSEGSSLDAGSKATIASRVRDIKHALDAAPKTLRWKVRAKVGERVKWYDLPEEVRRG